MTRWQGTMMLIGLRPLAHPTAWLRLHIAQDAGEVAVAARLAVGNVPEQRPHP